MSNLKKDRRAASSENRSSNRLALSHRASTPNACFEREKKLSSFIANCSGTCSGKSCSSLSTTSGAPPQLVASMGTSATMASSNTMPKGSWSELSTKRSKARKNRRISGTWPRKRTRSVTLSCCAHAFSLSFNGPSPAMISSVFSGRRGRAWGRSSRSMPA